MTSLTQLLSQYPILWSVAKNLQPFELLNLGSTSKELWSYIGTSESVFRALLHEGSCRGPVRFQEAVSLVESLLGRSSFFTPEVVTEPYKQKCRGVCGSFCHDCNVRGKCFDFSVPSLPGYLVNMECLLVCPTISAPGFWCSGHSTNSRRVGRYLGGRRKKKMIERLIESFYGSIL